ncbi:MAG: ABC transporter permease [Peptostreptococcaceae bacterium]
MSSNSKKFSILESQIFFSFISILLGLLVGSVVLVVSGINPLEAYKALIDGTLGDIKYIAWVIIRATPLILTGLSIAFAFKTGLFNIGAEGQFLIGALVATIVGVNLDLPAILQVPITIFFGMLGGAVWGGIAGFLKSKFGINEVIVTIMLNWIAFYTNNMIVRTPLIGQNGSESSLSINSGSSLRIDFLRETLGPSVRVNWGIFIVIIVVFIVAFILFKTTLGFELRAVGFNKFGAEYAGINVEMSIFKSMAIAGAIAGLAGTLQVMGVSQNITVLAAPEGYGFDGIAVALIANSSPIGVIFSGLLFGLFKYGGSKMQSAVGAPSEIINIVIGSIIYFIALSNVVKYFVLKLISKKGGNA